MLGCGLPTHIKAIFDVIWFELAVSSSDTLLVHIHIAAHLCLNIDENPYEQEAQQMLR